MGFNAHTVYIVGMKRGVGAQYIVPLLQKLLAGFHPNNANDLLRICLRGEVDIGL
jgi:hypothetical protein